MRKEKKEGIVRKVAVAAGCVAVGAGVGVAIGGPIGAAIGAAIGAIVGAVLFFKDPFLVGESDQEKAGREELEAVLDLEEAVDAMVELLKSEDKEERKKGTKKVHDKLKRLQQKHANAAAATGCVGSCCCWWYNVDHSELRKCQNALAELTTLAENGPVVMTYADGNPPGYVVKDVENPNFFRDAFEPVKSKCLKHSQTVYALGWFTRVVKRWVVAALGVVVYIYAKG